MSDYLTPAELVELTEVRMPSAQIRWLQARAWKFEVGQLTGRPKVSREYYRARMCTPEPLPAPKSEPPAPQTYNIRSISIIGRKTANGAT